MLRFFSSKKDDKANRSRTILPYKPIELLVHKQDTLLIRVNIEGGDMLLQSIDKQVSNLFRVVNNSKEKRYYLKIQDTFYPIHHRFTRHLIVDEYLSHNEGFYVPKKLTGNYQAIEFAYSFENQLYLRQKRKYFLGRNRIGISYTLINLITPKTPVNVSFYQPPEYYIQGPDLSLGYERQINTRFPWIYGQLQMRLFHMNLERTHSSRLWLFTGEVINRNISETIKAANLYFYPGLLIEFRQAHSIRPFIGGGAAFVLPLKFFRHLEIEGYSGLPSTQTLEHIQETSAGHFMEVGMRYNYRKNCLLGFSVRQEHLAQNRRSTDIPIVPTRLFPNNIELAAKEQFFVQLQFQYSW